MAYETEDFKGIPLGETDKVETSILTAEGHFLEVKEDGLLLKLPERRKVKITPNRLSSGVIIKMIALYSAAHMVIKDTEEVVLYSQLLKEDIKWTPPEGRKIAYISLYPDDHFGAELTLTSVAFDM